MKGEDRGLLKKLSKLFCEGREKKTLMPLLSCPRYLEILPSQKKTPTVEEGHSESFNPPPLSLVVPPKVESAPAAFRPIALSLFLYFFCAFFFVRGGRDQKFGKIKGKVRPSVQ